MDPDTEIYNPEEDEGEDGQGQEVQQ
jgi:hypothetical protein